MAVPSTQLAQDPRALTAIAQWATRDDKPDAQSRRSDAIVAMWRAGVISPEEFEGYGSQGITAQLKKWNSGYYAKKFKKPDAASLQLYANWYKLLYPPVQKIAIPGLGQLGFVPPVLNPVVPEQGETPPPGDEPPATPSRGMGPFLLAAGGLLALVKILGK